MKNPDLCSLHQTKVTANPLSLPVTLHAYYLKESTVPGQTDHPEDDEG